jgi:hypothetical protein
MNLPSTPAITPVLLLPHLVFLAEYNTFFCIGKAEKTNALILKAMKATACYYPLSRWPPTSSHEFYRIVKNVQNVVNSRAVGSRNDEILTPQLLLTGSYALPSITGLGNSGDRRLVDLFRKKFIADHFQLLRRRVRSNLEAAKVEVHEFRINEKVLYSAKIDKLGSNKTGTVVAISPLLVTVKDSINDRLVELHPFQLMPMRLLV